MRRRFYWMRHGHWRYRCGDMIPSFAQHLRFTHRQLAGLEIAHDGVVTIVMRTILGRSWRNDDGQTGDDGGREERAKHALHAIDFHDALLPYFPDEYILLPHGIIVPGRSDRYDQYKNHRRPSHGFLPRAPDH